MTLSMYATAVEQSDNYLAVRCHATPIVTVKDHIITLRNGGYYTATTKRKMNQSSRQFDLGFHVYQENRTWYVRLANGITAQYVDGIQFKRLAFLTPDLKYRSQYD